MAVSIQRWLFPMEKWSRHLMDHPEQTWLVVEDPYVWAVMSENYMLSELAVHQWHLPPLQCGELAEYFARHQLSGFDVSYPDNVSWNLLTKWYEENSKAFFLVSVRTK